MPPFTFISNVACLGSESSLTECSRSEPEDPAKPFSCPRQNFVGVECTGVFIGKSYIKHEL